MLVQTKNMIRTSRVLLLSIQDYNYKGELVITDKIPFSTCMMDLMEQPGVANIINKSMQITQFYNYPPHIQLWLELVKNNEFLATTDVWFGGFLSWIFQPGD